MRKKLFTFLLALATSVGMMYAWTSGDCTVTLDAGVVTVSGPGAMGNYTYFTQTPWYSSRNSITSIIIEDGVTNVGDYAFMRLDNLQSVVIGNNVVTIGSHAFEQCGSSFTSLTLGNSIVEIGEKAFINNSRITSINLPNTLQTIGKDAFYGCTRISSLTIPSSVTSIGDYAFGGCSLIAYIIAEPTTPPSTEENTFSIVTPSYIPLYVPNGSVADYTAAERWNTFNIQGYDPSTGPTIEPVPATPDQLSGAFTINSDGDQINFSKGNLQYVGSWQFAENQWNIIGNDQADNNRDLFGWGTGDAPNKISTTLADYAVYHEWGTNMGDGWYTLSKDEWTYLFQSRTNAANLYAPAKVNGVNGFVILPDEFTLPSGLSFTAGVTNYGTNFYANAAWRAMENAGAVFLPVDGYRYDGNKIKWVGQDGFYWSSTVASEGASAWSWLISASNGARRDYYNLHYGMSVRLVKAAAPSGGSTPANVCGDGLTWELSEGVLTISYDGVGTGEMTDFDYEYDQDPVNVAPWKENKSEITTVIVGDGVKSIGNYAFNDLYENFTAVTIANSVERIGVSAFMNAKWITEITLPSSLKTIDKECFAANFGFSSITIPSGVTSIGNKAFCYCTGLTSLTCEATTPPTLASSVFYKVRSKTSDMSNIPLYVPSESVDAYEAAAQWNAFDIHPAPAQASSVTAARFVYNYDCQRNPAFPKVNNACSLSGFKDPYEGYKGYRNGNIALGPWKLEFVANYTPSNNYDCASQVNAAVYQYYSDLSDDAREAKKLEVPIFRLLQYNLSAREYQHAAYGIVCAYAGEANAQDHAALFVSSNGMGCFLSGHQHTSGFNLTCENDLTTGMADLVAAASAPSDPYYDVVWPVIVSIDAIGPVELSEHCKYYIEGSRAAYNALTDEQKAQVTNYSTLTDAEAAWADLVEVAQPYADAVIALINAIPDPVVYTQECKDKIDAAQAAYDALTDGQKMFVSNYETLKNAPSDLINAAPYVHILFTANNQERKVENVTLPKEFEEAEMRTMLKELYGVEGDYDMYAYSNSNADAVNISYEEWTIYPFMGKVNVHGNMDKYDPQTGYEWIDFSLEISLELPPFGSAPAPTAAVIGDPNNASEVETFLTTYDGQTIDELIIDRPVLNNMYNTLCLPFDMNATQIAASSLNGVEIREFTGASVEGTTLNLSVGDPVNAVVAGRPYFVKFSAASQLDDLHFEDVTINNALLDNMAVTFDGVTFKGTFTPFVMPNGLNFQGGYLFLGQNNQLFWPNTSNPLKPFRAYFYVDVESSTPGNAPKYRGMPARIVEGKNVTTGVENAQSANQSTKVIVNGQLIIIKNDVHYNAQGQIVK